MKFTLVDSVDEVLEAALEKPARRSTVAAAAGG
jgi:hypothetical protein